MTRLAVAPQYLSQFPYYARNGQDRFLDDAVFHHKTHGVFVDLGAYDGIQSSNTLFFEESRAWTGVCVEPLPDMFARLRVNRACRCVSACASDAYGIASFTHVIQGGPLHSPEGRTLNFEKLSGLVDFYSPSHREAIDRVVRQTNGRLEPLQLPCVPVNDILAQAGSRTIDCLSVDTEGSELHILQAIDFQRFDIDAIVVEVLQLEEDLARFMEQRGYHLIQTLGFDWIYTRIDRAP